MVQEHGISRNKTLSFKLHEGKGWWLERKSWSSNHRHRRLSGEYTNRLEEVLKMCDNYITETNNLLNQKTAKSNLKRK
jgi:hypothetical protein